MSDSVLCVENNRTPYALNDKIAKPQPIHMCPFLLISDFVFLLLTFT